LNWLKFNIIQREQAALYCKTWEVSALEEFGLPLSQREKLVRDFEIFLDDTLMRPKPTKHEMRTGFREKYRKEKYGIRARSESPPSATSNAIGPTHPTSATHRWLLETSGFSSGPRSGPASRQASPITSVRGEVPRPGRAKSPSQGAHDGDAEGELAKLKGSLSEEQVKLALQLQAIKFLVHGLPHQERVSAAAAVIPTAPPVQSFYEFPILSVMSEQEKRRAWSELSGKLLESLGFSSETQLPSDAEGELKPRSVEEILGIQFPATFQFPDEDPYCLLAAGVHGLNLPPNARLPSDEKTQGKRWQRNMRLRLNAEPLPEPPPSQPATHRGAEKMVRVLEWALRATQRRFKRAALRELRPSRPRPSALESPKSEASNVMSLTLGNKGELFPSPTENAQKLRRPVKSVQLSPHRGAGDPFPGAVPSPASIGLMRATLPPGGLPTPRQGNWAAASPRKPERLQAPIPTRSDENYVGVVAWRYSQNSPPDDQEHASRTPFEPSTDAQQAQRAANWMSYLRTKDPTMLTETGIPSSSSGAEIGIDGVSRTPKTLQTPRNLPPIPPAALQSRSPASTPKQTPPASAGRDTLL